MIPVTPQPEPEDFDTKVRQKGLRWLAEHDIDITDPELPQNYHSRPVDGFTGRE